MLRELPATRQVPGEKMRRWFFCHELDLVVWFDHAGHPVGFQLAYDKYRDEHSIAWHVDRGFRHYLVDEGDPLAGESETPLLYADGAFDAARVSDLFRSLSSDMPPPIAQFVMEKLSAYPVKSRAAHAQ